MLISAATGQRVRPQRSVCNRAVSATPAFHDHDVSDREKAVHAVVQATVQRVVVLGLQNGLHDPWISTNVFPQAPIVAGIIELSAVDRPY